MFSTRIRQVATHLNRRFVASTASRSSSATTSSSSSSLFSYSSSYSSSRSYADWILVGVVATTASLIHNKSKDRKTTLLAASLPSSGDIISAGVPLKEPATGILFPQLCNGYYFAGCGVRVKYGFVKVYAVGTYIDPLAMSAVIKNTKESKNQNVVEEALLNPTYPRTIRIVMNRSLSIDKYTAAIIDALKPRMMGQDLEKLEEFKALNPKVDLVEGAEIEMTIRGDTLLYKNALGGVGTIRSEIFTRALCDTFYGADPVSPTHKASVLQGVPNL